MKKKITSAQQIIDIIKPIPKEKFITGLYGYRDKSCFLGHINRHMSENDNYIADKQGFGARELTKKFLVEKYPEVSESQEQPDVHCCRLSMHHNSFPKNEQL